MESKSPASLSPEERTLVEDLLQQWVRDAAADHPPERAAAAGGTRGARLPLSYWQEQLWLANELNPASPAYNVQWAYWLTGRLDAAALERSLGDVVRRHEILRTTFQADGDRPSQMVRPDAAPPFDIDDWSGSEQRHDPARVDAWIRQESTRPFDLSIDAVMRFRLLRLGDLDHVLQITVHHIVWDGWSTEIFFRELAELYDAHRHGRAPVLPALTLQYGDYSLAQRDRLQGGALERLIAYWQTQLAGAPPILELPADRRPAVRNPKGALCRFDLGAALTERLKVMAREEAVTPFMVLLAAFAVLLHRYTAQDDIVVGSPITSRSHVELEPLIGLFLNTLVLRTDLSGNPTMRELLGRARRTCLGAYAHQEMPFEKLVETLKPERRLNTQPLFQVMFAFQNSPAQVDRIGDVRCESLEVDFGTVRFDLALYLEEKGAQVSGALKYDTELFDPATVGRMRDHYVRILTAMVADRGRRLDDINLLDEGDEARLRHAGEGRRAAVEPVCVQDLIDAQARRTPDAVAVRHGDAWMTYAELSRRAGRLAQYLRHRGVGPDVLVGLCVERTPEMLVGLLGILKAGGGYVPLDPGYPQDWVAAIAEETRFPVLVTHETLAPRFAHLTRRGSETEEHAPGGARTASLGRAPIEVVAIDSDWPAIERARADDRPATPAPEHLAYVLYTSGSTGRPKGVAIEHRSLTNYLTWVNDTLLAGLTSSLPAVTNLTFDASLKQVFAPLLEGKRVWLFSVSQLAEPGALLEAIASGEISGLNCVPSLWEALLDLLERRPDAAAAARLSDLFLGGDRLDDRLVARSRRAVPGVRVWNIYGPTETTANASVAALGPEDRITIGRPIANTTFAIVDRALHRSPVGVPGELRIGGAGLARGYLNRPDLTAETFVPDAFGAAAGARLYRSGDLARYLTDGTVEYLGRLDHQVKIRGFRVELPQIESALGGIPGVKQAAVVVRDDPRGDKRLVAYVVAADARGSHSAGILERLRQALPPYMVPSLVILLPELPRLPSGKLERRALPEPVWEQAGSTLAAPRDAHESTLLQIWTDVLKRARIGVLDSFFELGGHSLTATQLVSRVNDAFGTALPLSAVFEAPTIRLLAAEIERFERQPVTPAARPIARVPRTLYQA